MVNSISQDSSTYPIAIIRADACHLVRQGLVKLNQPIYELLAHIPDRDRESFERELELNEYLLRDRIADLIPRVRWQND